MTHTFIESLEFSHKVEDLKFWGDVYRQAFPDAVCINRHREDGDHQRLGVDRSVVLSNSKIIRIDEKVRRDDYGDIAIEYLSDKARNVPGWACKQLLCDYIAYAILPAGKVYFLPVPQLQAAWASRSSDWLAKYGTRDVVNTSWTTCICPVPVDTLFAAMGSHLRCHFEPAEGK